MIVPSKISSPQSPKVAKITKSAALILSDDDELETDVFDIKPSAKAFLGEAIWGVVLIPFIIGLILLLHVWLKTKSLSYRLTTQRLFVRKGLISKRVEEIELFRVKDVTVNQGIIQRMLGFGTIIVLSSDDSTPKVVLMGVPKPNDVKEEIRTHYRAARKREKVRATEFIPS